MVRSNKALLIWFKNEFLRVWYVSAMDGIHDGKGWNANEPTASCTGKSLSPILVQQILQPHDDELLSTNAGRPLHDGNEDAIYPSCLPPTPDALQLPPFKQNDGLRLSKSHDDDALSDDDAKLHDVLKIVRFLII